MLTVLVPIQDSDATQVESLPAVSPSNINVIYKHEGVYKRVWLNPATNQYEYHEVVDREFPYLGKPLEIFDFTYDATRMGHAPTIAAQDVMWYADKDENGDDITLEGLWSQQCHVTFNGENLYLKQIPTSSKTNEDARYKYDIDFVSERAVLEQVYIYDVVQPFVSSKPISESAKFSFYGDITELAKRINASLIKSGLASIALRDGVTPTSYLTYEEFNSVGLGTYSGTKDTSDDYPQILSPTERGKDPHKVHANIYEHFGGDYTMYLLNKVYEVSNPTGEFIGYLGNGYFEIHDGDLTLTGYQCVIGKDKKGEVVSSEEKLIQFENNTIHEALQQIHDVLGLQYYIYKERDGSGNFTGNTIIMIADCEHDFADWDQNTQDYVRDSDGIPTTTNPFDYGADDALISKEKTNTTDKIITRITGVGSEENIPWYYPNPTADGWIKPTYSRNGEQQQVSVDYPTSEGSTQEESSIYEKYLKNRVGDILQFGRLATSKQKIDTVDSYSTYTTHIDEHLCVLCYRFVLDRVMRIRTDGFDCSWENTYVSYLLFKDDVNITSNENAFFKNGGTGTLQPGTYNIVFQLTFTGTSPSIDEPVLYYYYPEKNLRCTGDATWGPWRYLLSALSQVFSTLGYAIYATIYQFWVGWDSTIPAFLSTKPNLKYVRSSNAKIAGWYDGNNREDIYSNVLIGGMWPYDSPDGMLCFKGGDGVKRKGYDDVYRVSCYNTGKKTANLQVIGSDPDRYDESQVFLLINSLGFAGKSYDDIELKDVNADLSAFIRDYITFGFNGYLCDGWYKKTKKVDLSDYGIGIENIGINPDVTDTIEFTRVKYVTPQSRLMPDVYIKSDGERRFYNAHDYYKNGSLLLGVADPEIGEIQEGQYVKNPLYKENESDGDDKHYVFENEFYQITPHEHIEEFDDIKPTIKGQQNYIAVNVSESDIEDWANQYVNYFTKNNEGEYVNATSVYHYYETYYRILRIDVVEEFAYDLTDNDEVWESVDGGNMSGEYKHPYFFAKLRPLGFNIFDLALQDDMVLSMTTGHCGACNFKIAVDENTKKNPVQVWQYDVYRKNDNNTYDATEYKKNTIRRYVDTTNLYYKIPSGSGYDYVDVNIRTGNTVGFLVPKEYGDGKLVVSDFSADDVANGKVGSLKNKANVVFEGDIAVRGGFLDIQQDTTSNYVWVALQKDTDTYGTIMPSAKPDYGDGNYSVFIEPKGARYYDRYDKVWETLSDEEADKFVITNIRLPQAYLRSAERDLSKRLISYMYENNYNKFNFSINFSRIFLAQNETVNDKINENSVVYVYFNRKIYRQYVKHYTYKITKNDALPEISVDMNEELSVTRTVAEQQASMQLKIANSNRRYFRDEVSSVENRIVRRTVGKNDDVLIGGNITSVNTIASISGLRQDYDSVNNVTFNNNEEIYENDKKVEGFVEKVNTFNTNVSSRINQIRETVETRLLPVAKDVQTPQEQSGCSSIYKYSFEPTRGHPQSGEVALFWLLSDGSEQTVNVSATCPTSQGMTDVTWQNYDYDSSL